MPCYDHGDPALSRQLAAFGLLRLRQKVVLVTGASSGIGAACARRFAADGARLVLTARSEGPLSALAESLAPAETLVAPADLTDDDDVRRLAERTIERFGRVDVLINNAGAGAYAPSFECSRGELRRLFELNFFAVVDLTNRLLPWMPRGSVVVNVGSVSGKVPLPWQSLYSASKFALDAYSDALRMELSGSGIDVVAVSPGYVDTPFSDHAISGRIPERIRTGRPFKITPEECAEAIRTGVRRRRRHVVVPAASRLLIWASRWFPSLTHERLAARHPVADRLVRKVPAS